MTAKFLLISHEKETTWPLVLRQTLASLGELELVTEEQAFERVSQSQCDLIIVDASAIADTLLLISRLRHQCPQSRIVVATASPTWQQARDAFHSGATDYIRKTLNKEEILATVKDIMSKPQPSSWI
jgi:DNA-binding NarL/FixJ family response regulator